MDTMNVGAYHASEDFVFSIVFTCLCGFVPLLLG
jgi:hypothetical protein